MTEIPPPPAASPYKDRRIGLIVGGVVVALAGGFIALSVCLMPVAQWARAQQTGEPIPWSYLLPQMATNLLMAGAAIWLGVGSMLALRWARAVMICASVMVFCVGLLECALLPSLLARGIRNAAARQGRPLPPGAEAIATGFALFFAALFLLILPALFFWYYRKPDVKRTVEARDPVARWTDDCPLPLVAICLLQVAAAPTCFMLAVARGVPLFLYGVPVPAMAARLFVVAFGLFSLYAARGFYRRRIIIWAVYLAVVIMGEASTLVTLARVPFTAMASRMGMPAGDSADTAAMLAGTHGLILRIGAAGCAIFLLYLIYLRRYFPGGSAKAM